MLPGLAQQRINNNVGTIVRVLFLLLFAGLAGAATALVGPPAVVVVVALLGAAVALLLPLAWLVVALILLSFLVTGQLTYFARFDKAFWLPFLVGALLLVRFPLDSIRAQSLSARKSVGTVKIPLVLVIPIAIYLATVVASTLLNMSAPLQILVSSREYIFMWGLFLICARQLVAPEFIERIWSVFPWLMLIQLPLILYQRFVVMPRRTGTGTEWDAVVGAFGGNPLGGGASGAMGIFCVVGIIIVVERWRRGLMSLKLAILLTISGILSIGLAEVKLMIILLPIAMGLLFRPELIRNPVRAIIPMISACLLSFAILIAYQTQFAHNAGRKQSIREYIEKIYSANVDAVSTNSRTGEISRIASLVLWYDKHSTANPTQMLLGHGIGATHRGGVVIGDVQRAYPFELTKSAISMLLWEIGILGTIAYFSILLAAYSILFKKSIESWRRVESRSTLSSMAVAVGIFILTLPYDLTLVTGHQAIIMLMLCLGYAVGSGGKPVASAIL